MKPSLSLGRSRLRTRNPSAAPLSQYCPTVSAQQTGFLRFDGHRIAFATVGSGPPLVLPAWWVSNVVEDWKIPAYRRFMESLAAGKQVIRYDRLGCGMSDRARQRETMTLEYELGMLDALVDHLRARQVQPRRRLVRRLHGRRVRGAPPRPRRPPRSLRLVRERRRAGPTGRPRRDERARSKALGARQPHAGRHVRAERHRGGAGVVRGVPAQLRERRDGRGPARADVRDRRSRDACRGARPHARRAPPR